MDIHLHIPVFIFWWILYTIIVWNVSGFILAGSIIFYTWYNGYDTTSLHLKSSIHITMFGLISYIIFVYYIISQGSKTFRYNVLHNLQDGKILSHGRKSPRVLRTLTGDET